MKKIIAAVLFLFLLSCTEQIDFQIDDRNQYKPISEIEFKEIKLEGEIAHRESEISGLAWYRDYLILLPQFPFKFGNGLSGSLFYIPKSKIIYHLQSKSQTPLKPARLKLFADGLEQFNRWGSGYEGIIFKDNDVYIVFESYKNSNAFVVKGEIDFTNNSVTLEAATLQEIEIPTKLPNLTAETITLFEDKILILCEVNGINLIENPKANLFSSELSSRSEISLPNIEYRVTDATEIEKDSTFWVINYLWPGEINYIKPQNDTLFDKYGIGKSHQNSPKVERLVKLKISNNEIQFADQPPIYIQLNSNRGSRNWEGLVKLDEIGFLVATDMFPRTILGFIPNSK